MLALFKLVVFAIVATLVVLRILDVIAWWVLPVVAFVLLFVLFCWQAHAKAVAAAAAEADDQP